MWWSDPRSRAHLESSTVFRIHCSHTPPAVVPCDPTAAEGSVGQTTLLDAYAQTRYIVIVRIGKPARKHGVADVDIWHAVRNSPRWMVLDNDLTMLIGPGTDGALLEIGVLGIDGDDPVVIHAMRLRARFYRFLE